MAEPRRPLVVFLRPQARPVQEDHSAAARVFREVFEAAGLDFEIISPGRFPWNPFARMHNAYAGLDPLRALRVLAFRRRAMAIVGYTESPTLLLLLLRRLLRFRPPVLLWEVSWSAGWKYRDWLCRRTIPYADRAVVYSSNQLALLARTYRPPPRGVFQPMAMDLDALRPVPGSASHILSVGLDAGRDFGVLLQATRGMDVPVRIKAGRTPVRLDPTAHPNVELIERFLPDAEFRQLYADAAIVVVSTFDTPNACGVTSLLEAMAMARPVIVSDNPALRDYIPPADCCVVVPIGDAAALRAAIDRLLADPAAAAAMGQRARAYQLAHNTQRQCFERMVAVLRDAAVNPGK